MIGKGLGLGNSFNKNNRAIICGEKSMMKPSGVSIFLEFIEKKIKVVLHLESTVLFNETSLIQTPKGGDMHIALLRGVRLIEVDIL